MADKTILLDVTNPIPFKVVDNGDGTYALGVRVVPGGVPVALPTYTTATRPNAVLYPGAMIYVSDAAGGSKLQYSDGAAWVAAG